MTITQFLFLVVVFLANIMQIITGFAGTLLAMPASIMLIGADSAKAILNLIGLVLCLYIVISSYKDINKKQFLKMISIMLLGMYLGIFLYSFITLDSLLFWYGIMIILIGAKKLFVKKEFVLKNWVMLSVIFLAGVIHGLFVSGGALLVVYATTTLKDKASFRATLSAVWVVLNSFLLIDHISSGYFDPNTQRLAIYALVPAICSVYIGNKIYDRVKPQLFMKLTYILLILSGISIVL